MYAAIVIPNFSQQAILRLHEELRARAFAVLDEEKRVLQKTPTARRPYGDVRYDPHAGAGGARSLRRARYDADAGDGALPKDYFASAFPAPGRRRSKSAAMRVHFLAVP